MKLPIFWFRLATELGSPENYVAIQVRCTVLFCNIVLYCMSPSAEPYLNIFLVEDVAKTSETTTVVDVWTQLCNQQTSEIGTRRKNKS